MHARTVARTNSHTFLLQSAKIAPGNLQLHKVPMSPRRHASRMLPPPTGPLYGTAAPVFGTPAPTIFGTAVSALLCCAAYMFSIQGGSVLHIASYYYLHRFVHRYCTAILFWFCCTPALRLRFSTADATVVGTD